MLAREALNTSTPESHSQGTLYKPTDRSMVLEPLDIDPNLPGIPIQLVKSLESSAFRVTGVNTNLQYMLNDSFILDSRATYYVYNDKSRFTDFRLPIDNNVLYTSESIIPIKGFKTVLVIVTTSEEPK